MKKKLEAIGFDSKESEIYLALIKLEKSTVNQLMKNTSIERRTIYDILERLMQKGWASYFEENETKTFMPTNPNIILEDINQKQKDFEKIIPQLTHINKKNKDAKVEILKGEKGLRTIFNEIINKEVEHFAFGDIAPLIYEERYSRIVKKFIKQIEEKGLKEKIIYAKGDKISKIKKGEYKSIEKELILPTPTIIYDNIVTQYIYTEQLTIIKITSEDIAKTHKEYFNHFWKLAKGKR